MLSHKQHIQTTKMKVATRNNLLKKLGNSKWGTNASTIRTTALALCYSIVEYNAPVWARSSHADILDLELNNVCRAITGCLKPNDEEDQYLLVGIAHPYIRRDVFARIETTKQMEQETHFLLGHISARCRLNSRKDFLISVKPSYFPKKSYEATSGRGDHGISRAQECSALMKNQPRGMTAPGSQGDA